MNYSLIAKRVIDQEIIALTKLRENIPRDFTQIVDYILQIKGRVIVLGIGKSSFIAKKIAASLASTGTIASFVHLSEALHGDLGMIGKKDVVIILSNSGETAEIPAVMGYCRQLGIKIIGITMQEDSTLGKNSDFILTIPFHPEVSAVPAPTSSAIMMLAIGDALVTALHEARKFSSNDFRLLHPAGKIGANLLKVVDLLPEDQSIPVVNEDSLLPEVILTISEKKLGCAIVTNAQQDIIGMITDGDLRRHLYSDFNSTRAVDMMSSSPAIIGQDSLAIEALQMMNSKLITVLPVVNNIHKLVGVIHIHELIKRGIG